jgi:hypothetical protein
MASFKIRKTYKLPNGNTGVRHLGFFEWLFVDYIIPIIKFIFFWPYYLLVWVLKITWVGMKKIGYWFNKKFIYKNTNQG